MDETSRMAGPVRSDDAERDLLAQRSPDDRVSTIPRPRARSRPAARQVVLLSAAYPYPADGGNKVVLDGMVRYFVDRYGACNVHYVLVGTPPTTQDTVFPVHVVPRPRITARTASVARRTVLGGRSLQESVLWSPATRVALRRTIATIGPHLLVADTVRMGQYLRDLDLPSRTATICYLDDLYSERYRNMLALRRAEPQLTLRPLASYADMVPRPLRPLTEWSPTQRAILTMESHRVERAESRAVHEFDRCLLVNDNEAARLRARVPHADPDRIRTIRPLVTAPHAGDRDYGGGSDYLIIGAMSGPHNDLAARWLLREVLPRLRRTVPDAHIDVVGRSPSPELVDLAARTPGARLHGFVPDVAPLLARTCAVLNPPRFASGLKLKVLEAMAAGVPVVSTRAGADGVATTEDQGVLVADTADDFARAMDDLRDRRFNARVGARARAHHAAGFARGPVFAQYDDALDLG